MFYFILFILACALPVIEHVLSQPKLAKQKAHNINNFNSNNTKKDFIELKKNRNGVFEI
jgi:hypothetical protein